MESKSEIDMKSKFIHRRRVLFGDCDPGGIIYTPRVAYFVVEAGLEFYRARLGDGAERRMFAMGIAPPARALSVEFFKPMTWDDELEVEVSVKEIRTHAIVLSFVGRVVGNKVFAAEITQVCTSKESMRPTPVPKELRDALLMAADG
jgi:4-hydroxybenzoyl-CoA thioesterase